MDFRSLSPRVDLGQSRKQAKDLLRAFKADDPEVLDRIREHHPRFGGLTNAQITEGRFVLDDAQLVVARMHYFETWAKLRHHIESLERRDPHVQRFEDAADATVGGHIEVLQWILSKHPGLVHQRSTRAHQAPLLHYVSANGVEDYRQISPTNAVQVAHVLLDGGAEVDATSEAYGGGLTTLGLVATSTPPQRAGVQIPLIDLLLHWGAAIDGITAGRSTVRDALANGCPEAARALAERGAKVADVVAAAGVGQLALLEQLAYGASERELQKALVTAAGIHGNYEVVKYLLGSGVDPTAGTGWTALHAATGGADLQVIDLLIERGAPLEKKNMYGGTVLGQAIWFAYHGDPARLSDYADVIEALIAAGARMDAYPLMREHIREVYRRAERG